MDIVRAGLLQTFEFYLDDDRYAVPTLKLVVADDEAFALATAQRLLDESRHHRGVEVCVAGQRLTGLGTFASRRSLASPGLTAED
jgi:hypothetical protein